MEYEKSEYQGVSEEKYEGGYSEAQSALDKEIQAGGWKNLKKLAAYKSSSRRQKIVVVYQAVSNSLSNIAVQYAATAVKNPKKADTLLTELKKLRMIQDILLNCLIWEPRGQLERDMIPQDVWDLIE